jgi:hypothetical protein
VWQRLRACGINSSSALIAEGRSLHLLPPVLQLPYPWLLDKPSRISSYTCLGCRTITAADISITICSIVAVKTEYVQEESREVIAQIAAATSALGLMGMYFLQILALD